MNRALTIIISIFAFTLLATGAEAEDKSVLDSIEKTILADTTTEEEIQNQVLLLINVLNNLDLTKVERLNDTLNRITNLTGNVLYKKVSSPHKVTAENTAYLARLYRIVFAKIDKLTIKDYDCKNPPRILAPGLVAGIPGFNGTRPESVADPGLRAKYVKAIEDARKAYETQLQQGYLYDARRSLFSYLSRMMEFTKQSQYPTDKIVSQFIPEGVSRELFPEFLNEEESTRLKE